MNAILTGQFISRVRMEKGMTQKELAQKVGVTDKAVSKWETGRGMPDISSLDALCNALDVSVNELLSGEVLPPEFYEKKAEENMKTLIKENEKNTKGNWIQMILGEVLVIVAFVLNDPPKMVHRSTMKKITGIILFEKNEYAPFHDFCFSYKKFAQWRLEMDFTVRNVTLKDYNAVVEIMNQVQQMHVEWRPDIYKPNDHLIPPDVFEKLVEGENFFVAETAGTVVGILEIVFRHIENPSHVTRDVIFIDSMAVDEKYRGMGVGHLFFEKVKEIKEQKKFDGIELQVNAKNRAAYEMYSKYGFTEKSINMELN